MPCDAAGRANAASDKALIDTLKTLPLLMIRHYTFINKAAAITCRHRLFSLHYLFGDITAETAD